jgi:hypothetical protein
LDEDVGIACNICGGKGKDVRPVRPTGRDDHPLCTVEDYVRYMADVNARLCKSACLRNGKKHHKCRAWMRTELFEPQKLPKAWNTHWSCTSIRGGLNYLKWFMEYRSRPGRANVQRSQLAPSGDGGDFEPSSPQAMKLEASLLPVVGPAPSEAVLAVNSRSLPVSIALPDISAPPGLDNEHWGLHDSFAEAMAHLSAESESVTVLPAAFDLHVQVAVTGPALPPAPAVPRCVTVADAANEDCRFAPTARGASVEVPVAPPTSPPYCQWQIDSLALADDLQFSALPAAPMPFRLGYATAAPSSQNRHGRRTAQAASAQDHGEGVQPEDPQASQNTATPPRRRRGPGHIERRANRVAAAAAGRAARCIHAASGARLVTDSLELAKANSAAATLKVDASAGESPLPWWTHWNDDAAPLTSSRSGGDVPVAQPAPSFELQHENAEDRGVDLVDPDGLEALTLNSETGSLSDEEFDDTAPTHFPY